MEVRTELQSVRSRDVPQGLDGVAWLFTHRSDPILANSGLPAIVRDLRSSPLPVRTLEAKGVTQAQLSQQAGIAKSTISEVLARKRPFSRQMIRKLAEYFRVDVSLLASNL
jgi:HTH-type transcriptional regulator/antitoxin HigA